MGYKCEVDEQHYNGAPVKVVTHQRRVQFFHDRGMTESLETVKEAFVHPDNVDVLGDPVIVGEVKAVDARSPKARKRDSRRSNQDEIPSYLQTWNDYQRKQLDKVKEQERNKVLQCSGEVRTIQVY